MSMAGAGDRSEPVSERVSPGTGIIPFSAGAAGIAVLLLAYYRLTWGSFLQFKLAIDVWSDTFPDFGRYYYPMGEAIFRGTGPIEGFVYSPFVAILMAAFTPLGLSVAMVVWGALQALAVVLYLFLTRRLVPARLPLQLFFVALTLSSFPLLHNFKFGQVPIFMTVALLGMLVCYERGWRAAAALLFAFAVSFKWYPLLFLALFAARRDWRFLLWAAGAGALLLVVVPVTLLGLEPALRFYDGLRAQYAGFGWTITSYNSQYFPHVIYRLAQALWGPPVIKQSAFVLQVGLPFLKALSWGVVIANLALVYWIQRAGLLRSNLWSAAVLFLTVPFVLGTSWPVDLVPMSFVQAFLLTAILNGDTAILPGTGQDRSRTHLRTPRLAAAGMLVRFSMLFSNIVLFNFIGDRTTYGSFAFVFWADALLLITIYLLLVPAIRQRGAERPVPLRASQPA